MSAMTREKIENLKNRPKSQCFTCNSSRSYTNPMAKCWECEKKYCFDHIYSGQMNNGMKENDELRDICDNCKNKYEYNLI